MYFLLGFVQGLDREVALLNDLCQPVCVLFLEFSSADGDTCGTLAEEMVQYNWSSSPPTSLTRRHKRSMINRPASSLSRPLKTISRMNVTRMIRESNR